MNIKMTVVYYRSKLYQPQAQTLYFVDLESDLLLETM